MEMLHSFPFAVLSVAFNSKKHEVEKNQTNIPINVVVLSQLRWLVSWR